MQFIKLIAIVLEKSGHDMQKLISLLLGALVHSDQQSELLQRLQCINGEEAQIVAELTQVSSFL